MNSVGVEALSPELIGSRPAPGALAVVQAFTNSVDLEAGIDRMSDVNGFLGWLTDAGLIQSPAGFTEDDRCVAIELREGIRELIRDRDGGRNDNADHRDAVPTVRPARFERAIDRLALTVTYREGAFGTTSTTLLGAALGPVVEALWMSFNNGTGVRLKVCARDKCQWLFYDNSRNQASHWCTPDVCGSREKARRAYARSTGRNV